MKNKKTHFSLLLLVMISSIGVSAQPQRQPSRIATRQISAILQRLDRNTDQFRDSLNRALVSERLDETRPQNDINSFEPAFDSAFAQFRDRFAHGRAVAGDLQNLMHAASLVNGFMTRNRMIGPAQSDWTQVRADLNALANAYGVNWQWTLQTLPPVNSSRALRLPDSELNQLIRRIETGGDTFRSSLTDAFSRTPYDQTTAEGNMNDAVSGFKNATVQLRYQFDTRQPVTDYVTRVLAQATPIDNYMRNHRLTTTAQNDWSTLRGDLNMLARAFNILANWQNGPRSEGGQSKAIGSG